MKRLFFFLLLFCVTTSAFAAASITGTVTNQTTHKAAAGDDVVLIRLAQGMQEATRTKTDARGHFELDVPDDGIHLVRVTHDKANYFKPAPPGTQSLDIDVFNAAAKVPGVSLDANVIRLQTEADGKSLKVVENFFLKNESTPPRTQFSDRSFEFTLPDGAIVEGAAAQGTGGMTVQSPPVPLPEKGHYAFIFPIRPGGQTRFQISYKLPYNGSLQFAPLATMATDNLVVMMPKAMKFDAGSASPFNSVAEEMDAQTYVARGVAQGKTPAFTVSGAGQLPRPTTNPQDASQQDQGNGPPTGTPATGANTNADPGANTSDNRPGGGLGAPIGSPDPLTKYKWWIVGGLALLLAGGAGFLLSRPQQSAAAPVDSVVSAAAPPSPEPGAMLMQVLRDELFTLESERLTGKITQSEYDRVKPALETVLQHALTRHAKPSGVNAKPVAS
ncbi:carboxypeptidase regulatory-like domain-containing protein [Terriglobus sp.]|uniref:carboxypeptidase regulatory-like domain-containing protein n=1 Tax=Terriglobus sp. TaxID=1889013 RepID=UPI003AFF9CDF